MFKDFILKDTELAIKQAVEAKELGQMDSTDGINLVVEKPKNPDFGDFAVNVSSLARNARIVLRLELNIHQRNNFFFLLRLQESQHFLLILV